MTDLLDGILAAFISLVINLIILARLRKAIRGEEGAFLSRVYVWSLLLRHAGAILLNIYASDSQFAQAFWGDSETYDYGGLFLSQIWAGEGTYLARAVTSASGYGFHYFVAAIYFIFGRNQLLVQFLNATIGSLSILAVYLIARGLFDDRAARWPALFMAFFPQMIFWSCGMYKDPSILLFIALSILAVLRLREHFTVGYLGLYVLSCVALVTLRFYVFYVVAFATIGTFAFSQKRGLLGGVVAQGALGLALALGVFAGIRGEMLEQQRSFVDLDQLQIARFGQSSLGRSAYAGEINVSTPAGAMAALPIGLVYLLFAPFPWALTSLRQVLTLPETLVWYSLMPALLRGIRFTLAERFRAAMPILVFALILTLAYAVFQSNVGTAYRQRTQVTMFFFIFIGAGIEERRRQRATRGTPLHSSHRPPATRAV